MIRTLASSLIVLLVACDAPICSLTPLPAEAVVLEHRDATGWGQTMQPLPGESIPPDPCAPVSPAGLDTAFEVVQTSDLAAVVDPETCSDAELNESNVAFEYQRALEGEMRMFVVTLETAGCFATVDLLRVHDDGEDVVFGVLKRDDSARPTPAPCDGDRGMRSHVIVVEGAEAAQARVETAIADPQVCVARPVVRW